MRLKIDNLARRAVWLPGDSVGDGRRYYELRGAIIVCRGGLALPDLLGAVVDCSVGWDTVMAGFTLDEARIGQRRTKVTIYRRLFGVEAERRLSDLL